MQDKDIFDEPQSVSGYVDLLSQRVNREFGIQFAPAGSTNEETQPGRRYRKRHGYMSALLVRPGVEVVGRKFRNVGVPWPSLCQASPVHASTRESSQAAESGPSQNQPRPTVSDSSC